MTRRSLPRLGLHLFSVLARMGLRLPRMAITMGRIRYRMARFRYDCWREGLDWREEYAAALRQKGRFAHAWQIEQKKKNL